MRNAFSCREEINSTTYPSILERNPQPGNAFFLYGHVHNAHMREGARWYSAFDQRRTQQSGCTNIQYLRGVFLKTPSLGIADEQLRAIHTGIQNSNMRRGNG